MEWVGEREVQRTWPCLQHAFAFEPSGERIGTECMSVRLAVVEID